MQSDGTRSGGKPPVATGPQRSTVIRISDLPCRRIAARYSSQSGCSPEMQRKYSTSPSSASGLGMSSTSAVPSTCTHASFHSSERTSTEARGSRRRLVALARSGYVEMTIRPSASTPPVTGESCGRPSARVVTRIRWWRVRTKSSSSSRSTRVFVAIWGMPPR